MSIGVVARNSLEEYMETNPETLDAFKLKSDFNQVIINCRSYAIKMAKQIRQRLN